MIAILFLVYGFALALWEIKNDLPLFWGSGSSVFNIGVINSALIIGVSIFFFASNAIYGLCAFWGWGYSLHTYIYVRMEIEIVQNKCKKNSDKLSETSLMHDMKVISYRYIRGASINLYNPRKWGFVKHKSSKEVIAMKNIKRIGYLM